MGELVCASGRGGSGQRGKRLCPYTPRQCGLLLQPLPLLASPTLRSPWRWSRGPLGAAPSPPPPALWRVPSRGTPAVRGYSAVRVAVHESCGTSVDSLVRCEPPSVRPELAVNTTHPTSTGARLAGATGVSPNATLQHISAQLRALWPSHSTSSQCTVPGWRLPPAPPPPRYPSFQHSHNYAHTTMLTCARLAAATGASPNSLNSSSMGAPSSFSIAARASTVAKGCVGGRAGGGWVYHL